MQAQTETTVRFYAPSKPKGRKDSSKQDAVIEIDAVRDGIENLESLYKASVGAADAFNDAIKAIAEKSGLLASVVRKFVVARVGEKFEERKRETEQLSLLFEDVGE